MRFFPVVERELRVLARTGRLYWSRFFAAQIASGLVAWFWFTFVGGSTVNAGQQIFAALSVVTFGYCLIVGIFLTSDSISEEKRDGTLGLLFLTDLTGIDVAFGKLASNSLQAIYNLVAIFPVMTIPLLLGGLTGKEIFRMSLTLVGTLLFSLTVGLLVSTWSKHDRKAQAGTFSILLGITGGVPLLYLFLKQQYHLRIPEYVCAISPGYTIAFTFDSGWSKNPQAFWFSLGAVIFLSLLAFLLSAVLIRRVWQDRPEGATRGGFRAAFRRWRRGSIEVRGRHRETLLRSNPYYWLSARDRLKPYYVLWFLGGCALFWLVLWSYNRRDMLEQEAFLVTALLIQTALKVWLASEAGRQFFDDRKNNALELTLSTPLPVREILEGEFLALFRQFGPAVAIVLIFDVLGMVVAARRGFGADSEWLLTWVASIVVFLLDAATLAALGMWLGLTAKRFSRAMARNLFLVLILPWIIFFALIAYMAFSRLTSLNSLNFVIGIYFVISLLTDAVLFLNASGNLAARFRELATQRFDSAR
jgi:hypothetical protein